MPSEPGVPIASQGWPSFRTISGDWLERAQWIIDHPGWTFAAYDAAAAGDITFQRAYETMRREAEQQARARAEAEMKARDNGR